MMNAMNQLQYRDEFVAALANYQPSDQAKQLLARVKLALLVGPSSSGRNTIINQLLESPAYHFIVSDTTRKPRQNNGVLEQNGREYWFRTEADLLQDIKNGAFLEAAVIHDQQVSGISMRELAAAADTNSVAINEIEVVGAENIHGAKPDTQFFFILPPSFDEWMVRMNGRGTLPSEEVTRRLHSAVNEIQLALTRDYYQFVVNDTFKQTAEHIDAMIMTGDYQNDQAHGREVAQQLLIDTQKHLGL